MRLARKRRAPFGNTSWFPALANATEQDSPAKAGLHQQSNENERFSENLNANCPFVHAVLQSFGRLTELCRQFEQRGFRVKFCGLIREFHTILGLSPI
jgi:hypothetical protein